MTFTFNVSTELDITIVELVGELMDKNQAIGLVERLEELVEERRVKFVFDLSELRYMNSSGLNVLIGLLTMARKAGGEVMICCLSKKVNELLLITKLNTVFSVTDSREKAISKLK